MRKPHCCVHLILFGVCMLLCLWNFLFVPSFFFFLETKPKERKWHSFKMKQAEKMFRLILSSGGFNSFCFITFIFPLYVCVCQSVRKLFVTNGGWKVEYKWKWCQLWMWTKKKCNYILNTKVKTKKSKRVECIWIFFRHMV